MSSMTTIEIDFDIHKLIENERKSFDESKNDALRRLLRLGPPHVSPRPSKNADSEAGAWIIEGTKFSSPSAAAGGVARTKHGTSPSLDGWKYWQAKLPGDLSWIAISVMRQKK